MPENNCNNCMLYKKGDCFGKSEICEDFRYSPSMTSSDKEYWPTIMRSNRHSDHIEYKKKQEKLAQLNKKKTTESELRVRKVAVASDKTIYVQVKASFVKQTIKKGKWNREELEADYSQAVLLFLDVKKGANLCNYSFVLQFNGNRKQYSGYSFYQSFNAVFLEAINDAVSRIIRPIDIYIVNSATNRLDKIVDVNSFEVREMDERIKEQAESKKCSIYELVYDTLPSSKEYS